MTKSALLRQVELLTEAIGSMAAIKAVTASAARYLRQHNNLGTIAPRRHADMLVVDSDPKIPNATTIDFLAPYKTDSTIETVRQPASAARQLEARVARSDSMQETAKAWRAFRLKGPRVPLRRTSSLTVFIGTVAIFLLNVNLTAPHRLYRDRLARTFIHKKEGDVDSIRPDQINPKNSAPYHLINATVNLPSSTSVVLRERKGDFFLFSKHWCGRPRSAMRRQKNGSLGITR